MLEYDSLRNKGLDIRERIEDNNLEVCKAVCKERVLNDNDSEVCEERGRESGDSLDDNSLIDL